MSIEERNDFLAIARIAKLAVLRADGSPTIIPVWFEWDGTSARVFTSRRSWKVSRLRADPRAALSVETGVGEKEAWVTLEGQAAIEEGGWDVAKRLAPRYYNSEQTREALSAWDRMADDWVVIRITPTAVRSSK